MSTFRHLMIAGAVVAGLGTGFELTASEAAITAPTTASVREGRNLLANFGGEPVRPLPACVVTPDRHSGWGGAVGSSEPKPLPPCPPSAR